MALIAKNRDVTIRDICIQLKMSESGIKKILKKLKDENRLQRVGSLKAGHWETVDEI